MNKRGQMNKRGAEMAVGTLVIIVLAVIVLVVLALGFGMGWSSLWSKLTGYISPVNVDSIKQACQYACTTSGSYAYCCDVKKVVYEQGKDPALITCENDEGRLGLSSCSEASCNDQICKQVMCETDLKDKCADNEITDSGKNLDKSRKPIPTGKVCCKAK